MKALAFILCAVLTVLAFALILALSWAITVGIVYLICMIFGLQFKLIIATGIWLIMILIKSAFGRD